MNVDTGKTYDSLESALEAGERRERLVQIQGPPEAVKKVQQAVKLLSKNQAKRERRKAARKR